MATPKDNPTGTQDSWQGFKSGRWQTEIDVQNFIQKNYTPYEGDSAFLAGPTERTKALWAKTLELVKEEHKKGVLDVANHVGSSITAHGPGYIDKDNEVIVGLQTDAPLKRAIFPFGGARLVKKSLEAYGFEMDPQIEEIFKRYRKDHNNGVFDVYTPEIRKARHAGILTGLPDSYGRGRIIGDYRRVALYGVDRLIEDKNDQKASLDHVAMSEDVMRLREELSDQMKSLNELKEMAASYGCDIARPAATAREAVQWTYFGYLGAVKEQDGAAMSFGRTSTFLDIYFGRDLDAGLIDESAAQEIIDHLVIKLRIVRFLRP
ncbi:MAG: pyruvate formate lyase family protein, partial [Desulfobacterales bacterium]|nr:pyruvate formate lyase family protein [Desulfobacterales bacterium]